MVLKVSWFLHRTNRSRPLVNTHHLGKELQTLRSSEFTPARGLHWRTPRMVEL